MGAYFRIMIVVTDYCMEYSEDKEVQYIRADGKIICPFCACGTLIKKGWRRRKLILIDDEILVLMVGRVQCKDCNKIHHVLPDIIVPYKRHDLETIRTIILENHNETFCEESVVNRIKAWWRRMLLYIAMLKTTARLQIPTPPELRLSQAVRALANANLWPRTRIALGAE